MNQDDAPAPPTQTEFTVVFLGGSPLVSRLPEVFARVGVNIIVFGPPHNPLASSEFVHKYTVLETAHEESWAATLIRNAQQILATDANWFIVENDTVAYELARSDLALGDKLRLLPTQSEKGLTVLGSKVGLASAAQELGLNFPHTVTAHNASQLSALCANWKGSGFLKSDLGGGGKYIRHFTALTEPLCDSIPSEWFPLIVQQEIQGTPISIEALFRVGELGGWMCSVPTVYSANFGPSIRRKYFHPQVRDFIPTLERLGRDLALHGLFNCSFIWDERTRTHYLYEADPRPNPWHQFGPRYGVDWVELMRDPQLPRQEPSFSHKRFYLSLYPRAFIYFGMEKKLSYVLPWVLCFPGTWNSRNRKDRAQNREDRRIVCESLGISRRVRAITSLLRK